MTSHSLGFHPERPCLHPGEHCGREVLLRHVFDRLGSKDNVQSSALIGFSRSGKTSFLNCLRHPETLERYLGERAEDYIFAALDAATLSLDGESGFFEHFYKVVTSLTGLENLVGSRDFKRINDWLEQHDKRLVCVFDNFNLVVSHPGFRVRFFDSLRAWFYTENRIGCILTSPVQLLDLSMSKELANSPFVNIFNTYQLGPLQLTEAVALIESRLPDDLRKRGKDIFDIVESVGGAPYLLQQAGARWTQMHQNQGITAFSDAEDAVYKVCQSYYEERYAALKTRQLQRLGGLLQGVPQECDNALIDQGIVDPDGKRISARLFERFLRKRLNLPANKTGGWRTWCLGWFRRWQNRKQG